MKDTKVNIEEEGINRFDKRLLAQTEIDELIEDIKYRVLGETHTVNKGA